MNDRVFLDTCVLIAWVFYINSLHSKSKKIFEEYSEYFWSFNIQTEFDKRFYSKQKNLRSFYNDLQKYLQNPSKDLYSYHDLINFALKNYQDKKCDDAKDSVKPFWDKYVGTESQILFNNMKSAISLCLNDINIDSINNKSFVDNLLQLTPQRNNLYSKIDSLLESEGVHFEDREVILDGHDFACKSQFPIDFVTFDYKCCAGAKKVKTLCFNSIKGKYDFLSS